MNLRHLFQSLSIAALALGLSACVVDPYAASATTYSPGYQVAALPSGYATVSYGGTPYYHHRNVYYRPYGTGYVVVDSPYRHHSSYGYRNHAGIRNRYDYHNDNVQVIERLPGGYSTVRHGGRVYYRSGGTYYTSRGNGYMIVPRPY